MAISDLIFNKGHVNGHFWAKFVQKQNLNYIPIKDNAQSMREIN